MSTDIIQEQIQHHYENLRHLLVEGARTGTLPKFATIGALEQLHATMYAIEQVINTTKEKQNV